MSVFSPSNPNSIVPSQNNYVLITLNANNNNITLSYPTSFVPLDNYMAPYIEVTNASGFQTGVIKFDDIDLTSLGNGCIISNIGAENFSVKNYNDELIVTIQPSEQYVFFIGQVPATEEKEWKTILLGSTTSEANALFLAGHGLSVGDDSKLNSTVPTLNEGVSITINNSVTSSLINWTGGTYTVNLNPTSFTPVAGFYFYLRNSSTTNGLLTLNPQAGSTIDGLTSLLINAGQSLIIILDMSVSPNQWYTVGLGAFGNASGGRFTQNGVQVIDGTAAQPSYSFISHPDLGFYADGSTVGFTSGGVERFSMTETGIDMVNTNSFQMGGDNILYLWGIYP